MPHHLCFYAGLRLAFYAYSFWRSSSYHSLYVSRKQKLCCFHHFYYIKTFLKQAPDTNLHPSNVGDSTTYKIPPTHEKKIPGEKKKGSLTCNHHESLLFQRLIIKQSPKLSSKTLMTLVGFFMDQSLSCLIIGLRRFMKPHFIIHVSMLRTIRGKTLFPTKNGLKSKTLTHKSKKSTK